jgi:hypothetical protein
VVDVITTVEVTVVDEVKLRKSSSAGMTDAAVIQKMMIQIANVQRAPMMPRQKPPENHPPRRPQQAQHKHAGTAINVERKRNCINNYAIFDQHFPSTYLPQQGILLRFR